MNVAVIGGGGWGTALSSVLARKGHAVRLWVYEADLAKRLATSAETIAFEGTLADFAVWLSKTAKLPVTVSDRIPPPAQRVRFALFSRRPEPVETWVLRALEAVEGSRWIPIERGQPATVLLDKEAIRFVARWEAVQEFRTLAK